MQVTGKKGRVVIETIAIECPICDTAHETYEGYGYFYEDEFLKLPAQIECRQCHTTFQRPTAPHGWAKYKVAR